MRVEPTAELAEVLVLEPRVLRDARGHFLETYSEARYVAAGLDATFVQDNVSRSVRGVLRGLHYQQPNAQGKLVTVLHGSVWDVAVDIRIGSSTFGRWVGVALDAASGRQLWIPPGFAHGFVVTSDEAVFAYKCTTYYDKAADRAIRWDDPTLGIAWPVAAPVLSAKDAAAPLLADVEAAALPAYPLAVR